MDALMLLALVLSMIGGCVVGAIVTTVAWWRF
jgi:hypothetical protein